MLCEVCKKNTATVHYSEVINGTKSEHHLCMDCASNEDFSHYSNLFDGGMHLTSLLSGLLGAYVAKNEETDDATAQVKCPSCGMEYGEFVKKSSFGCADCYDVFGPLISDTIKKLQGSDTHVGKKPMIYGEPKESAISGNDDPKAARQHEIDILSKKLREAVSVEDFDEAARLRDEIAELKKECKGADNE